MYNLGCPENGSALFAETLENLRHLTHKLHIIICNCGGQDMQICKIHLLQDQRFKIYLSVNSVE